MPQITNSLYRRGGGRITIIEKSLIDLEIGEKIRLTHLECGAETFGEFVGVTRDSDGMVWIFKCVACGDPVYIKGSTGLDTVHVWTNPGGLYRTLYNSAKEAHRF